MFIQCKLSYKLPRGGRRELSSLDMCRHKNLMEKIKQIKSTHLSDVFPRATEVQERNVDEIRAVAHCHRLLLERILRSHRNDLSQFKILHGE